MLLEIYTNDTGLALQLMENPSELRPGIQASLPGGAVATFQRIVEQRMVDIPKLIEVGLTFTTGVSASLVANYLYEKLKGGANRIRINGIEITLSSERIKEMIVEEIRKQSPPDE